ncbi:MAG TPA: protoporphyrinogen oxidase [Acidimicrobiales bacterium]|nr:protoporphyrinogen oxidase [Acidimicrobiales bacterium]
MPPRRALVVGGGIAGLTSAYRLRAAGVDVVLVEASDRWGGKIRTTDFAGGPVDEGADAFLARRPEAIALCAELGIDGELVAPATGKAWLWTRGALRAIPDGTVIGVPADIGPVLRSRALSLRGRLRVLGDVVLPASNTVGDESIAAAVTRRFGPEVTDRLVDPLLGGINAGRTDRLSLLASAPQLASARSARGMARALRGQRSTAAADGPVFLAPRAGMQALVDSLVARLEADGAELRLGTPVSALDLDEWGADTAVVTTPAPVAAGLLAAMAPEAATALRAVEYASVALVTAAFAADEARFPEGSGFLVPRVDGKLLTACTWFTAKWPHLARPDQLVIRLSAGKIGDARHAALRPDDLVARLLDDLGDATGVRAQPSEVRVTHWPDSFPQYDVGHLDRVAAIEAALPPHVAVAGAALHGVGIPACIGSAAKAAAKLLGMP